MLIQYITKGNKRAKRPAIIQSSGSWGERTGAMVGFKRLNEYLKAYDIYIGYSLKNKKEWDWNLNFDKEKALIKAVGKAESLSPILVVPSGITRYNSSDDIYFSDVINEVPQSIRRDMLFFINRCRRYFSDASLTPFWINMEFLLAEKYKIII